MLLRLYLDYNDGAGHIPCPVCGRPLVLAAERAGRWTVGYGGGFHIRPDHTVMLVCPSFDCDYRETVEITKAADDAVVYSPAHAAGVWRSEMGAWEKPLDEIGEEIVRLTKLHKQTRNLKLPSAIRFWREEYSFVCWLVKEYLEKSLAEGTEIVCEGRGRRERGYVRGILHDGVLFERSKTGETILLRAGDLRMVAICGQWSNKPDPLDFRDPDEVLPDCHPIYTPTEFVQVAGHTLALNHVTRHNICRVQSEDPAVARFFGLRPTFKDRFSGEVPLGLVEQCFRLDRHCWVQGYRLHLRAVTTDEAIWQLETQDMDTARALRMHHSYLLSLTEKESPSWVRYFHQQEIQRVEETRTPMEPPRPKPRTRSRRK